MSTCLVQLVRRSKFKKVEHLGRGGIPVGIVYYIVTECLVVKKKKV